MVPFAPDYRKFPILCSKHTCIAAGAWSKAERPTSGRWPLPGGSIQHDDREYASYDDEPQYVANERSAGRREGPFRAHHALASCSVAIERERSRTRLVHSARSARPASPDHLPQQEREHLRKACSTEHPGSTARQRSSRVGSLARRAMIISASLGRFGDGGSAG